MRAIPHGENMKGKIVLNKTREGDYFLGDVLTDGSFIEIRNYNTDGVDEMKLFRGEHNQQYWIEDTLS